MRHRVLAAAATGPERQRSTEGYGTIAAPATIHTSSLWCDEEANTPTRIDDTIASYSSKGPTAYDYVVNLTSSHWESGVSTLAPNAAY